MTQENLFEELTQTKDDWIEGADQTDDLEVSEYDITATPNDFNVMTIASFIESGSIVLPIFQRNFTWDIKRASKLIESLILGLPVPQTFLYEESKNRFLILDGQQRLMSIYFFTKMRFPKVSKRATLKKVFMEHGRIPENIFGSNEYFDQFNLKLPKKTSGDSSPFEGLNYQTLETYKTSFDLRPIRNVIVKQNEPKNDNSSIYEIFDRLNTGGVILKGQEIRANLYYSEFYRALYELNTHPEWRRILQKEDEDPYMRDVELLLRAFALLIEENSYRPSMSRFLNEFSQKAKREYRQEFTNHLKRVFEAFMSSLNGLPDNAFFGKASKKFSIGTFEAIFSAKCQSVLGETDIFIPPLTLDEIESITSDDEFTRMLREGTTKQLHVKQRLEIAKSKIQAADHE
jgi:uncharacterized protein with ParB-like and HNH nuclease domain